MTCEICGNPNVYPKQHEATQEWYLYDKNLEGPHKCPIASVYCPNCNKRFPQNKVCIHYQNLNYKPGESEAFFIRNIKFPPRPKQTSKRIGTSGGNNRAKNTKCNVPGCYKDLNGLSYAQIEKHIEEHAKQKGQTRLL